jgi:hypothetical protein
MSASRFECPTDEHAAEMLHSIISRHLPNRALRSVLPALAAYLPYLIVLEAVFEVPEDRNNRVCLRVIEGNIAAAELILAEMADLVADIDPFQAITVNEARALFGLMPLRPRVLAA